jgi:hypothetical protein
MPSNKICVPLFNEKYIGYKCIVCNNKLSEDDRQKILSIGAVQTWCLMCLIKKYPSDNSLLDYANMKGDLIIDRLNFYKR